MCVFVKCDGCNVEKLVVVITPCSRRVLKTTIDCGHHGCHLRLPVLGPVWLKRRTYRLTATLPPRHQILSLNLVLNGAALCCLARYYEL
jgi:hypothetical protein